MSSIDPDFVDKITNTNDPTAWIWLGGGLLLGIGLIGGACVKYKYGKKKCKTCGKPIS